MTAGFGGQPYVQQESRALSSISETPGPDLSQGQEAFLRMLQGHDHEIRFLADEMKKTQKGVNEANQNPIQQIQQFIADVIVLLGGGELAEGALDFGDLQYILPALGALFGFGDGPFPVSLFMAAEKFFLGYVVPQQQFVDVINGIIQAWLGTLGIDPKFIKDIKALITAIGDLFDGINNLFPSVDQLFTALGISAGDLGPFGQVLGPIMKLFTGFDLSRFGDIVEFITDAIGPFIEQLTAVINFINSVLAVLGFDGPGGVVNSPIGDVTNPFTNLVGLLGSLNFADSGFDVFDSWSTIISSVINPSGGLFSGSLIPGLDASKITTGLFSQSQISGLVSKFLDYPITTDLIQSLTGVSGGSLGTIGATNLITNGSFPSNITGWTNSTGSASWESTIGHTAAGSMKMVAGANNYAVGNLIAATPGESIYFEEWFRTASITTSTAASVSLFAFTFDASSVPISADMVANVGIAAGTNTAWVKLSGSYVVPAGVAYVAVAPQTFNATGGFVYFDDFKVTKGSTTNILQDLIGGVTPGTSLLKDVSNFLTNTFNGITRNTALSASQSETSTAITGQTSIVSGTAAQLAQLVASFGAGNPDADDFERTSTTTLGANWRTYFSSGTGPVATPNGHDLHYGGGANTEWVSVKDNIQAATDHQIVTVVLAQAIPAWGFFTPLPFGGSIDIWLRCNNFTTYATRTGVRLRINSAAYSATAELANFTSGTKTVLSTASMPVPSTGAILDFEAGAAGNARTFAARVNGSEITSLTFTDSGLVTALGASYRYRGVGGQNVSGQGSPDLTGWTAQG